MIYSLFGSASSFENYWGGGGGGRAPHPAPPPSLILQKRVYVAENFKFKFSREKSHLKDDSSTGHANFDFSQKWS